MIYDRDRIIAFARRPGRLSGVRTSRPASRSTEFAFRSGCTVPHRFTEGSTVSSLLIRCKTLLQISGASLKAGASVEHPEINVDSPRMYFATDNDAEMKRVRQSSYLVVKTAANKWTGI